MSIIYVLAVIGAVAILFAAVLVIAALFTRKEARHVDPDLLIELPPLGERYTQRERGRSY